MNDAASLTRKSTAAAISSGSPARPSALDLGSFLRDLRRTRTHRRVDQTRGDRVHTYAVPAEARTEAPGQVDDRCLGRTVLDDGAAALSGGRSGVDDGAGLTGSDQALRHPLRGEEWHAHVHRHRPVELVGRYVETVLLGMIDAGIVEQHPDQSVVALDGRQRRLHAREVAQVALVVWPIARAVRADIDADGNMARLRESAAGCLPNQAVAAGDDRDLRHCVLPDELAK